MNGFTLVELVVVVMILGIIAAIAAPRLLSNAEDAREKAAATVVDNVRRGIDVYYAEHGVYPTTVDNSIVRGRLQNPYDLDHPTPVFVANNASHIYPTWLRLMPSSTFWYNRANGAFTARVPLQATAAETVALFNRVNDTEVVNEGDRN